MLHSIVLASTSNSLPTSPCCLQCANGAMYCQLFDLVKPGILNMQKVSKDLSLINSLHRATTVS